MTPRGSRLLTEGGKAKWVLSLAHLRFFFRLFCKEGLKYIDTNNNLVKCFRQLFRSWRIISHCLFIFYLLLLISVTFNYNNDLYQVWFTLWLFRDFFFFFFAWGYKHSVVILYPARYEEACRPLLFHFLRLSRLSLLGKHTLSANQYNNSIQSDISWSGCQHIFIHYAMSLQDVGHHGSP